MDLKQILKTIKLNETKIITFLGVMVILTICFFAYKQIKGQNTGDLSLTGTNTSIDQEGQEVYTVQKGDTLWSIAQTYYQDGFKWAQIAKDNNITTPSKIIVGQKITIQKEKPKELETKSQSTNPENKSLPATYQVEKNDNLWDISQKFYGTGYRWVVIAKENNLQNPNIIHKGNILKLPPKWYNN